MYAELRPEWIHKKQALKDMLERDDAAKVVDLFEDSGSGLRGMLIAETLAHHPFPSNSMTALQDAGHVPPLWVLGVRDEVYGKGNDVNWDAVLSWRTAHAGPDIVRQECEKTLRKDFEAYDARK